MLIARNQISAARIFAVTRKSVPLAAMPQPNPRVSVGATRDEEHWLPPIRYLS